MSLSRKRKRELNKLRSQAEVLLDEQRSRKRLSPVDQPWADGQMQQFPYAPN